MKLSLPHEIEKLIQDRVKSGQYHTAEEVVAAAVSTLAQQDALGDFGVGELNAILAQGDRAIARGEVMDEDVAFAELKRRHDARR